jgi:hypothetical protein
MIKRRNLSGGVAVDSKSKIGQLTREIDVLVREYVKNGDATAVAKASRLSREREGLLKPKVFRSNKMKEAS